MVKEIQTKVKLHALELSVKEIKEIIKVTKNIDYEVSMFANYEEQDELFIAILQKKNIEWKVRIPNSNHYYALPDQMHDVIENKELTLTFTTKAQKKSVKILKHIEKENYKDNDKVYIYLEPNNSYTYKHKIFNIILRFKKEGKEEEVKLSVYNNNEAKEIFSSHTYLRYDKTINESIGEEDEDVIKDFNKDFYTLTKVFNTNKNYTIFKDNKKIAIAENGNGALSTFIIKFK